MLHVETPESVCRFGLARGEITPPVGIYHRMWGAAAHDQAEGVHRPLLASVVVFQQPDGQPGAANLQVLVALDHCLMGTQELAALVRALCQGSDLAEESILVVCSHTHSAGFMTRDRASLPGGHLIGPYLEEMNQTVTRLTRDALAGMQEATISYVSGRCSLAAHRDSWDDDYGQWVCGYNPAHPADDTVLVARVTGAAGKLLATIVNYACHPTTLAWENRLISPDYPGAMREVVEQATGAPCVFVQGASGELGPVDGFTGDARVADRNGRQLGYAALSALSAMRQPRTRFEYAGPVVSGATLGTWKTEPLSAARTESIRQWATHRFAVPLRYRPGLPTLAEAEAQRAHLEKEEAAARAAGDEASAAQSRALAERQTRILGRLRSLVPGDCFPLQVVLWRMGDACWMGVQGEPYSLLQTELRRRFPSRMLVVGAIANQIGPSYLPPKELYGTGIYQETIALVAPGSLERLIESIARELERAFGI